MATALISFGNGFCVKRMQSVFFSYWHLLHLPFLHRAYNRSLRASAQSFLGGTWVRQCGGWVGSHSDLAN